MTYPLTTTLNRIWACNPCDTAKRRALKAAGKDAPDDEPITFQQIAEAVHFEHALWCCRAEPQYSKEWRLFGVWCARQVQHLMADERSIAALDVAERHANGEATDEGLAVAWDASLAAALAAARNAWDLCDAALAAALAAAKDGFDVSDAAQAAARAVTWDAWDALDATWDAAWGTARAAQRAAFIQLVTTGTLPELVRQEVSS